MSNDLKVGFVAPVTRVDERRCECAECTRPPRGSVVIEVKPQSIDEGPGWVEIGGGN